MPQNFCFYVSISCSCSSQQRALTNLSYKNIGIWSDLLNGDFLLLTDHKRRDPVKVSPLLCCFEDVSFLRLKTSLLLSLRRTNNTHFLSNRQSCRQVSQNNKSQKSLEIKLNTFVLEVFSKVYVYKPHLSYKLSFTIRNQLRLLKLL